MAASTSGAPPTDQLEVVLTGELVTIVGRSRVAVPVEPGLDLRSLFALLSSDYHPWFGSLLANCGECAGLGAVMLLLNGEQIRLPQGLNRIVGAGTLYLIPPIPGG